VSVALDDQEVNVLQLKSDQKTYQALSSLDGKALEKLVDPAELIRARKEKRATCGRKGSEERHGKKAAEAREKKCLT
jgi:hypothetical protein